MVIKWRILSYGQPPKIVSIPLAHSADLRTESSRDKARDVGAVANGVAAGWGPRDYRWMRRVGRGLG
jgi:hypothetical protein